MLDFETLFEQSANDEKYREPPKVIDTSMEQLMTEIEAEFTGAETAYTSRIKERMELNKKMVEAENNLKKIKNPRNVANASRVSTQNNEKREKLRKEIAKCKLRLSEIDMEEGKGNNEEEEKNMKNSNKNATSQKRAQQRKNQVKSQLQTFDPEKDLKKEKAVLPGNWNMNPYADL
jgi:hypothetical protein